MPATESEPGHHASEMVPSTTIAREPNLAPRLSLAELDAKGRALREKCPRRSQAEWKAPRGRPDPIRLLEVSNEGRIPELIPVRMGRMASSPFTFFRGAALNMAADLATTPTTGLRVQACGDCHVLNFGDYATPERRVIFEINDMDETLPAPWEWDVKRLAASMVLAGRNNGFSDDASRNAVLACVRSYREHMAEFAAMPVLQVWYSSIEVEAVLSSIKNKETRRREERMLAKARARSVVEHDFPKLVTMAGGEPVIKDRPPRIYHPQAEQGVELLDRARAAFASYRESLQDDRRVLLERFELKDIAIKVVGVGSVGTLCAVVLLMASDRDPLFLQVKEARASVLEPYAGKSRYANHGQRVVQGCRLMQSASDIFLGWTKGQIGRHVYIRTLKDVKISFKVESFKPGEMRQYADLCGRTLARAHARSGAPAAISGYLGGSEIFDHAIAEFGVAYADQTERDHAVLKKAIRAGRVAAEPESD
jgi:uncharacterized protein (DUF2252 family)